MATTLETFAKAKRGNYCTLPTIDVDILPDIHHCKTCNGKVEYDPKLGTFGAYKHVGFHSEHGYVSPKTRCHYCRSEEAVYRQHAWHDAIECDRCGGQWGHAIGD